MFRDYGNPPIGPFSEGEKTNPADELLMATSGALASGNYEAIVTVGASAAADFRLERRNAADAAAVGNTVVIKGPAGQSGQYRFMFKLETNERLSVYMDDVLASGTAAVALNLERLS